jgi:hypothetical protein
MKGKIMKRAVSILLLLVFVFGLSLVSFANTPFINRRERNQQRRIAHGIGEGQLTAREAARLEREEYQIHRYERHAKSDGNLSWRERQRLDNMLDREDRNIHHQRHDAQGRNP